MIDIEQLNAVRRSRGFLSVGDTYSLASAGVTVLDPFSTLVSPRITLAPGVTLWPSVILQTSDDGIIAIGPETQIFTGSRLVATGGRIAVGAKAEIGEEGGFTIKADPDVLIEIGEGARLLGGGSLTLSNSIGAGAQVLGPIRMQNCVLEGGAPIVSQTRTDAARSLRDTASPGRSMSRRVMSCRLSGYSPKRRCASNPIFTQSPEADLP